MVAIDFDEHGTPWVLCRCDRCAVVGRYSIGTAMAHSVKCTACRTSVDLVDETLEVLHLRRETPSNDGSSAQRRTQNNDPMAALLKSSRRS